MNTSRRSMFRPLVLVSAALFAAAIFTGFAGGAGGTPPGQSPPSATAPPTLTGSAIEGQTLSASPGSWSGVSISYTYQWNRCDSGGGACAALPGATGSQLQLASGQIGSTIRVTVIATNRRGTASATSGTSAVVAARAAAPAPVPAPAPEPVPEPVPPPPTSSPPVNSTVPQVMGTPAVGVAVSSTTGSWSGSPTAYAYQWKRCDSGGTACLSIAGATTASHTPVTADAGFTLRVAVAATNADGTAVAQSAQSSVISGATGTPAPTVRRYGVASGWRLPWLPAADQTRYLDSEKAMGVQIVRFDVNWPSIQAGGPTSYNWVPFDAVVQGLKSRGMDALGVIAYTPAWARPAGTSDKHAPTNVSDYANFCEATARHFAPLGVHNWEVWNEPNISGFFQPRPDVAKYTAMLKACYSRIKAVDPGATVITGGNSPAGSYNAPCATACTNINPVNFLEGIYANGGAGYFDALAHHPYSFPAKPSTVANWSAWYQMAGTSPSLRSLMIAHGDGAKKIWATEWGAPDKRPRRLRLRLRSRAGQPSHRGIRLVPLLLMGGPALRPRFPGRRNVNDDA